MIDKVQRLLTAITDKYRALIDPMAKWFSPYKATISEKTKPIRNIVSKIWSPINDKYLQLTSPIRQKFSVFEKSYPKSGWVIAHAYKWLRYIAIFFFALIFFSMIGLFGHMPSKTELANIENSNTTEVYSQDSVLIGRFFIENRTEVGLDKISPYVITALLAVEDKRFFEHSGIDLRSMMRVFKGIATNKQGLGGGSTLSQQLAKNLFPRKNYLIPGFSLLINKIRENIISIKLEDIYNKEELLNLYLNTVPFGGDRFGINVASKYFYNKKSKDLNPAEAATLIGMLKATTALDPTRNPENSKKRRNLVLKRMLENNDFTFESTELSTVSKLVANGKLSESEYNQLIERPVSAKKYSAQFDGEGRAAYFREYLRTNVLPNILKDLTKEDGTAYNLYRDGLKIYTTIDSRMQQYAEEAVQKHMSSLQAKFYKHWKGETEEKAWGDDKWIDDQIKRSDRYKLDKEAGLTDEVIQKEFDQKVSMTIFTWQNGGQDTDTLMTPRDSVIHYFTMLNTGFMAMDHHNGYIRAWVGGTNFKYFKYDHILSKRQVGSTFKPIVYAAAIQDSVKPCQFFKNEQITVGDWSPRNSDQNYEGWVTLQGGITYSVNTIAAQLIRKVGIDKTLALAKKMGITSNLPREFGISLGAADITLYDMMKVYGTMANKGVRPEPIAITKIVDRNGKVIYDYKKLLETNMAIGPHEEAMTEDEAAIMTRLLQSVIDQGTGRRFRGNYGVVGEYAGKTGTTQNHADGWFMVYNPYLVTGAWVGAPSPAVRFRTMELGQGASMALPIVGEFWKAIRNDNVLRNLTDTRFPENEVALNQVGCPLRIMINPDTFDILMQDSFYRDSIVARGYQHLEEFVAEKFGLPYDTTSNEILPSEILEGEPDEKDQAKSKEKGKEELISQKKKENSKVDDKLKEEMGNDKKRQPPANQKKN